MAQDFVVANPQRSLRGADDQSSPKLAFFTDDYVKFTQASAELFA